MLPHVLPAFCGASGPRANECHPAKRPRCGPSLKTSAAVAACPTCRQVNALAASWEDLRQGTTSFAAVRRAASGGSSGAAAAAGQPQRRRLVRAGALDGGSGQLGGSAGSLGAAAGGGRSAEDVISLLDDSPLPGRRLSGRQQPRAAGPAAGADEQRSWGALAAAVGDGAAERRRSGGSRCGGLLAISCWADVHFVACCYCGRGSAAPLLLCCLASCTCNAC